MQIRFKLLTEGGRQAWQSLQQIEKTSHVTLQALSEALAARGLKVHPATVGRFLARARKSFKKNRSARRADPA